MSIQTFCFLKDKEAGHVQKCRSKARFSNGRQCCERAIWWNKRDGMMYVMLNGEAHIFRKYDHVEPGDGYVYGTIC